MRYMVEQGQVIESKQKTILSGLLIASRFTKLTSVPIPHLPAGEAILPCCRMNSVEPTLPRYLDGLHWTFRLDNDVDVGVEGPSRLDLAGCEPGMYRAMPLPRDHLGPAELLRSISTQSAERIPDHHLIEGNTHFQAPVAAKVLVGQEQDPLSLIESPLKHRLGVG